jgi:hypothetical protein
VINMLNTILGARLSWHFANGWIFEPAAEPGNQLIRSISGGSLSINCLIFRNNCWLGSPGY